MVHESLVNRDELDASSSQSLDSRHLWTAKSILKLRKAVNQYKADLSSEKTLMSSSGHQGSQEVHQFILFFFFLYHCRIYFLYLGFPSAWANHQRPIFHEHLVCVRFGSHNWVPRH